MTARDSADGFEFYTGPWLSAGAKVTPGPARDSLLNVKAFGDPMRN